jgi:hypothetical protein
MKKGCIFEVSLKFAYWFQMLAVRMIDSYTDFALCQVCEFFVLYVFSLARSEDLFICRSFISISLSVIYILHYCFQFSCLI